MKQIRRFLKRLTSWSRTGRDEERLREEIEAHIAFQTEDNLRAGLSPEEARREELADRELSVGQADGSAARKRMLASPRRTRRTNGNASPAKFEPPPTHPITTSGSSPAISICAAASWPMTVW